MKVIDRRIIAVGATVHASTILALPDGDLMAAWFAGRREGSPDVEICSARLRSGMWSEPMAMTATDLACWNPVLSLWGDHVRLWYKVGRSPRHWAGFYMDANDSGWWGDPVALPDGVVGPMRGKPLHLGGASWLVPTSDETTGDLNKYGEPSHPIWESWFERTEDNGATWTRHGPIGMRTIQPVIWQNAHGHIVALMRSRTRSIVRAESRDEGVTWSEPKRTAMPNPNSAIDVVRIGGDLLALAFNPDRHSRHRLAVAVSEDEGDSWGPSFPVGEGNYPSLTVDDAGLVHLTCTTTNRHEIRHYVLEP